MFSAIASVHSFEPKMGGLAGFYSSHFPLLEKYMHVFRRLFQENLPELFNHFEQQGIPDLLWIHKWFQSCFLYSFPLGLCIRIWDNILAHGTKFLFQVALGILSLTENDLLGLDFSDINEYFKQLKDEENGQYRLLPAFETIIQKSLKIKVTNEHIEEIVDELTELLPGESGILTRKDGSYVEG